MPRHKPFTASFRAQHSNSRYDKKVRVYLAATEHVPRNVRVSQAQASKRVTGISLADAKLLAQPPAHTSSKHFAKQGLSVREVVRATPWDKGRYDK